MVMLIGYVIVSWSIPLEIHSVNVYWGFLGAGHDFEHWGHNSEQKGQEESLSLHFTELTFW